MTKAEQRITERLVLFTCAFSAFMGLLILFNTVWAEERSIDLKPDAVYLGVYAGSSHSHKGYNEEHNWKSARLSWDLTDEVAAGYMFSDFVNSMNKDTTTHGIFAEIDLVSEFLLIEEAGAGGSVNVQSTKGYDVPFLPIPYGYVDFADVPQLGLVGDLLDRTRLNVSHLPDINDRVPSFTTWMFEVNLWKNGE